MPGQGTTAVSLGVDSVQHQTGVPAEDPGSQIPAHSCPLFQKPQEWPLCLLSVSPLDPVLQEKLFVVCPVEFRQCCDMAPFAPPPHTHTEAKNRNVKRW